MVAMGGVLVSPWRPLPSRHCNHAYCSRGPGVRRGWNSVFNVPPSLVANLLRSATCFPDRPRRTGKQPGSDAFSFFFATLPDGVQAPTPLLDYFPASLPHPHFKMGGIRRHLAAGLRSWPSAATPFHNWTAPREPPRVRWPCQLAWKPAAAC